MDFKETVLEKVKERHETEELKKQAEEKKNSLQKNLLEVKKQLAWINVGEYVNILKAVLEKEVFSTKLNTGLFEEWTEDTPQIYREIYFSTEKCQFFIEHPFYEKTVDRERNVYKKLMNKINRKTKNKYFTKTVILDLMKYRVKNIPWPDHLKGIPISKYWCTVYHEEKEEIPYLSDFHTVTTEEVFIYLFCDRYEELKAGLLKSFDDDISRLKGDCRFIEKTSTEIEEEINSVRAAIENSNKRKSS